MIWLSLSATAALVGFVVTQAIWLHSANSDKEHCRDRLDEANRLAAQYESERDVALSLNATHEHELEQETALRKSVESRLADAEKLTRTYLAQVLAHAGQGEIDATVTRLFSRNPPGVPPTEAATAKAGADGLIDPDTGLLDPRVPG